jgi:hypothetical protein
MPRGAYSARRVPLTGAVSGHLTLILQPQRGSSHHGFLEHVLREDAESGAWFLGHDCKLCGRDDEYEFGQRGL